MPKGRPKKAAADKKVQRCASFARELDAKLVEIAIQQGSSVSLIVARACREFADREWRPEFTKKKK